jgi:hypothetical protein
VGGLSTLEAPSLDPGRTVFNKTVSTNGSPADSPDPSNLLVQQPIKFELVKNQKTAKALGLKITEKLCFTANEVIE